MNINIGNFLKTIIAVLLVSGGLVLSATTGRAGHTVAPAGQPLWAATLQIPPTPTPVAAACPPTGCVPGYAVGGDFWQAVLIYLGAVPNDFAVEALASWQQALHSPYCWNPLLTSVSVTGWRCPVTGTQQYPDLLTGARATAETLRLPIYRPLRLMLNKEAFDEQGLQQAVSRWIYGAEGSCDDRCREIVQTWKRSWQEHGISVLCPPLSCLYGEQVGASFYAKVFAMTDIPLTAFAVEALQAWAGQERAHACWNPLATVWEIPEQSCVYNAVGVQHYVTETTGAYATARTLALPYYAPLRQFLRGEAWHSRRLAQAVGIWVNGDPNTCQEDAFAGYCERLFARWRALWEQRDALSYNPLLTVAPAPTPLPLPCLFPGALPMRK